MPKKKSPSPLRCQERRKYEASLKSLWAASKKSAFSDLCGGTAGETNTSSATETEKDLPHQESIDEGAEDLNSSEKEDANKCTETVATDAAGETA